ncbi:Bacterial type II/III secretion system short domain protein [Rubripirellula obstinata]|uniref:Bacterial type II/III secretion system short domain protein n=1 Tax=Rubripirellula obstinata TaxID=406547 RepID=A0A5B1CNI1_9BACT|nr:secretin N-terminal domain-containing protein [Rubripirellula obstinata]KAA1260913.1 Bacterial type II/III secretion system short domain protein [Rubripirellula obstinata]
MFDVAVLIRSRVSKNILASILLSTLFLYAVDVHADEFSFIDASGKKSTIQLPPGAKPPPLPPGAKPVDGDSSGDKKSKDKKQDDAGSEPAEPKVIRRESTQDESSDPDELNVSVASDGKIAFEFRNQPWVDLIHWLADISDQPLDWLELPGDRVNLRSPGRYTVAETRDLFNRYLLARGYTLLEIDGGLTVAKTATINPAIVPRVAPEDLGSLPSHSFVRTSLDVGWLSADKLSKELAPMISSNGKLTALTTTNRIEAMDAAINLRQVARLLDQERSNSSREALAPEFVLRHLSASIAKQMLEEFLGVEKKKKATPLTPQQMQQMQMRQQQNNGQPPPQPKKEEIAIVANVRQNSILIRAPADRVAIATEFLKRIDVPGDSLKNLMDVQSRVQVFRLASLDAEKLIEIVSEMNVLEPGTRIRVDKDNKAIIVSGSIADRYIINSLIERLDGSGRKFEVLPLRRLDPNEVAESIAFLMGQKDDKDKKKNNRRSYYYSYYNNDDEEESKDQDEFRVAANSRLGQVLLWANEQEMEQVRSLLVKLGELPPPGGNRQTVRILNADATPETLEYLKRLKSQWSRFSPNPIELPDADQFADPNAADETESDDPETGDSKPDQQQGDEVGPAAEPIDVDAEEDSPIAMRPLPLDNEIPRRFMTLAKTDREDQESSSNAKDIKTLQDFDRKFRTGAKDEAAERSSQTTGAPQPIRVEVDAQGNLILTSPDTAALDRLESLMLQMKPPQRPYRVFHIKHASALWMKLNLEDYFGDVDEESDSKADRFYGWYFGSDDDDDEATPTGLGKGNKLKFVDESDTNTLVITGANAEQLKTIEELISLWDVPEPINKRKTRFTKLLNINYGKADKIAETVKEAYRDLLSSNDKAFTGNQGGGGGGQNKSKDVNKSRGGNGSGLEDTQSGRDAGGADFSFKGKLSIGIDAVGNTLLVSAEGEPLLNLVAEMINQLDEAARPQGEVQIVKLSGGMNGETLQKALEAISGTTSASDRASAGANNGNNRNRPQGRDQRRPRGRQGGDRN